MILTKKELQQRAADMDSKEICYALIWTIDEFDGYFTDHQISKSDWESALSSIDSESEEQYIKESIETEIQNLIEEKEAA
jgi:hypothetical protein